MRVDDVWQFAQKRHLIYLRRQAKMNPDAWTDDPILKQYRFCNVYRELDTVTDWLRRHWREPYSEMPDLWHSFVVARHMNNIPMLNALGGAPLPWDTDYFIEVAESRRLAGEQIFSGAYMIGTRHKGSKAVYLAKYVFQPLWEARETIRPRPGDSLAYWHKHLGVWYGLASFMSAQVIADIKYTHPLRQAQDWGTFCAMGPGSKRGLNRVMRRPLKQGWRENEFQTTVLDLRHALIPYFLRMDWVPPDAQDTQNILCEFDKYERARLGEGRPKQLFRGG